MREKNCIQTGRGDPGRPQQPVETTHYPLKLPLISRLRRSCRGPAHHPLKPALTLVLQPPLTAATPLPTAATAPLTTATTPPLTPATRAPHPRPGAATPLPTAAPAPLTTATTPPLTAATPPHNPAHDDTTGSVLWPSYSRSAHSPQPGSAPGRLAEFRSLSP